MPTLILLSDSFPLGQRETFLANEFEFVYKRLREAGIHIIIIPRSDLGTAEPFSGVEVLRDLCDSPLLKLSTKRIFQAVLSPIFWREVIAHLPFSLHYRGFGRLLKGYNEAQVLRDILRQAIQSRQLTAEPCVVYSYWSWHRIAGVGPALKNMPGIRFIARCHGGDLFAERWSPPFCPLQRNVFMSVDEVHCISETGKRYLVERYPELQGKFRVSRLGVAYLGSETISSPEPDRVRIVTCSNVIPLKRLDLFIQGLSIAANETPEITFQWTHFGDGPQLDAIATQASRELPTNAHVDFRGRVPNREVLTHYCDTPVDAFVNLSTSEGIPVSIMEAASFGIPAIATDVGATSEIVSDETGLLLPPNPSAEEVANALQLVKSNAFQGKRSQAAHLVEHYFNASRNYRAFADHLLDLLSEYTETV